MNPRTYIEVGDEIAVMYRSQALAGFRGRVLEVQPGEYGRRTIIIQRSGSDLLQDGAIGVPENAAVMSVRRGDSWVGLPLPLLIEEAETKAARSLVNESKRILKAVPLFADQVEPRKIEPGMMVENFLKNSAEELERDHNRAMLANELKAEVEKLTSEEDFQVLTRNRESYPQDGLYGTHYWRKHLCHIHEHGKAEIFAPAPPVAQRLNIPWLKYDATLMWATAPGRPHSVKVLWVGPSGALCQVVGEPIRDYDPKLIPNRNVWLKPEEFAEFSGMSAEDVASAA